MVATDRHSQWLKLNPNQLEPYDSKFPWCGLQNEMSDHSLNRPNSSSRPSVWEQFPVVQSVTWPSGALGYFWRTVVSLLSICAFAKYSHVKTPLCWNSASLGPPYNVSLNQFLVMQWFLSLCIPYLLTVMPKVSDHLGGVFGCSFLLAQNAPKAVTWSQTGWLPFGESWEK